MISHFRVNQRKRMENKTELNGIKSLLHLILADGRSTSSTEWQHPCLPIRVFGVIQHIEEQKANEFSVYLERDPRDVFEFNNELNNFYAEEPNRRPIFKEQEQHNLTADGGARSDEEPNLPNNSRSTIFTIDVGRLVTVPQENLFDINSQFLGGTLDYAFALRCHCPEEEISRFLKFPPLSNFHRNELVELIILTHKEPCLAVVGSARRYSDRINLDDIRAISNGHNSIADMSSNFPRITTHYLMGEVDAKKVEEQLRRISELKEKLAPIYRSLEKHSNEWRKLFDSEDSNLSVDFEPSIRVVWVENDEFEELKENRAQLENENLDLRTRCNRLELNINRLQSERNLLDFEYSNSLSECKNLQQQVISLSSEIKHAQQCLRDKDEIYEFMKEKFDEMETTWNISEREIGELSKQQNTQLIDATTETTNYDVHINSTLCNGKTSHVNAGYMDSSNNSGIKRTSSMRWKFLGVLFLTVCMIFAMLNSMQFSSSKNPPLFHNGMMLVPWQWNIFDTDFSISLMPMRPKRHPKPENSPTPTPSQESPKSPATVCYCNGVRQLGELEINCNVCKRWFHARCFKDLKDFYALPFMVSYVFKCHDCDPDKKENWALKQPNFSHMCVMALANMTYNYFKEKCEGESDLSASISAACQENTKYFNVEDEVIPYFDENWENITPFARRTKTTWHQTILKTLSKETDLFVADPNNETSFALKERDLFTIGPQHEAVKLIGKRPAQIQAPSAIPAPSAPRESAEKSESEPPENGPKTRGSSKRKTLESFTTPGLKKSKTESDFSAVQIDGLNTVVGFPFNREGYRYYLVEKDLTVPNRLMFDSAEDPSTTRTIPSHFYRVVNSSTVTFSPNDRAHQLKLSDDRFTVTGFEGYSMARATHGVSRGSWYFEVEFVSQPNDSHTRIGWSQPYAVLQACLGYGKFSYSWRSKKGTVFHDARGISYTKEDYKQNDVLGCLIVLPQNDGRQPLPEGFTFSDFLPPSFKDLNLIDFKHNLFFEEKEEIAQALKKLKPMPGSRLEFFLNGVSCGTAFSDIYAGYYYPAVSLFRNATVRCNFGPIFKYPPPGLKSAAKIESLTDVGDAILPMSERAEQIHVEQCLADMLYMVCEEEEINRRNAEFFEIA
ncbi:set1/Ash2 histone methyltransferase complex subunit ash-2 [Ditylenchus destructor]|uniref:Set1/Ash2 histone methyltransferase complex subunit ash-2 n=1 Tax=Ditylenchus destructor TaxID=166010 RepID=A0AAD4N1M0_9BILA|nr:set1/Ash2 histone methyltransferase complex subunit ash-2 [Ditylenchus destructor]